ncbi:MAG: hypothetical protein KAR20_13325, partial [Candidatus Heimdallarchaeota archaeon]|nr:hypothetical protein [Candidatus Heimdallarchaeota archaeon]
MDRLPRILIIGEIKTEYLISASGKVVADQPGGNLLYAAAGASLWSEHQKDIGLISKIGVNYPKENLEKILDEGFYSEGIRILDQKLEHRSFIAYTDLRTSHSKSPISYFSQTGDTFPVSLLG